jgi:predicted O-methyltransferase YrrM
MTNVIEIIESKVLRLLKARKKQGRWIGENETAVPSNWHETFIEHLASVIRPKVYMELGLYKCELFNRIVPYAQQLIGVDRDADPQKWVVKSKKARFVNSTTEHFAEDFKANPVTIDMLFIDADHSKEAVLRDFWNFFPFISDQGLILMHDTYPRNEEDTQTKYCADAYRAADELCLNQKGFEIMTIPLYPGLTICRKKNAQIPWRNT